MRLAVSFLVAGLVPVFAQQDRDDDALAQAFRENTYELMLSDQGLGGPAADFLVEATAKAQFLCFAEAHNVKEVPAIFTAMFRTLQRAHGYEYVAIETGPAIVQAAASTPIRGDVDAVIDLFKRFPESFHFYTDQELRSFADIGAASNAETPPLWGVDQVHAVPFIAHRLAALARTDAQRAAAEALYETADEQNRTRGLMGDRYIFVEEDGFEGIAAAFTDHASAEVDFLIEQLQLSYRIYDDIRSGAGYRSNYAREENMKRLFMKRYREAEAASDTPPKVLLRLGHWHLMRGRSPGNCYTLGNFVSEFAKSNGMTSFHLGVSVINRPGEFWSLTENKELAALAAAGSPDEWRVIDLRPLRGPAHSGALPGLTEAVKDWIFQYDAALLIGGATRGTNEIDRERKRQVRERMRERRRQSR